MNYPIHISDCPWDGCYLNKQSSGEKIKWSIHRTITTVQNIPIVRILDDGIASIIDELAMLLGLYKTGTFRYKDRGYIYTAYSFMTGEVPYTEHDYEFDEISARWIIYYSWWNIVIHPEDLYIRNLYGRKTLVVYPNTAVKKDVLSEYQINIPLSIPVSIDKNTAIMIVKSWLHCYDETDIHNLIYKIRGLMVEIIKRIAPEYVDLSSIITSRIRNFLIHYLRQ